MHPAKSVIFFTTASGAGYGLFTVFALFDLLGQVPGTAGMTVVGLGLAFALIVAGLLSSTFHLGHPERAWRALSQWRSSWLSREGVMAVAAFAPMGLYAIIRLFWGTDVPLVTGLLALLSIAAALATVYCTSMIYASLKPVHAWHNGWTVASYLVLSLMTGVLLYGAVAGLLGGDGSLWPLAGLAACIAGLAVKAGYWRFVDHDDAASTVETATGLRGGRTVRLLEAPHSQANYLMKEMVFQIARKHAVKLRRIALVLGFILPIAGVILLLVEDGLRQGFAGALIAVICLAGIYVERWLFFAEARHTVGLYYGAPKA